MNLFVCLFVFEGDMYNWLLVLIKHLYLSGIKVGKIHKTYTKKVCARERLDYIFKVC